MKGCTGQLNTGINTGIYACRLKDVHASIYHWPQCLSGGDLGCKLCGVFILHTADKLELIENVFYMGDMLWKAGDVEEAFRIRLRCA